MTFKEATQDYLEYVEVTKSQGMYNFECGKSKGLLDYYNNIDVTTIKSKQILMFIKHRRTLNPHITNNTLNKFIGTLKRIIKHTTGDSVEFKKIKEVKAIIQTIKQETITKVFTHLENNIHIKEQHRNLLLFKMLLDTGLRINEALNLTVKDINIVNQSIHVKITKTKAERYVFFREDTKQLLLAYIAKYNINKHLFICFKSKKMLDLSSIQTITTRLKNKLKLDESIHCHKWRHTFATKFIKTHGEQLEPLRLIMGHTNLKTTQRYLHLDYDYLRNVYFS